MVGTIISNQLIKTEYVCFVDSGHANSSGFRNHPTGNLR